MRTTECVKVQNGYKIAGVLLPFAFNLNNQVDPMAKKRLDEQYQLCQSYEVLDFFQRGGSTVGDPSYQVTVSMSGVYLVNVWPKDGKEQMHIVKVNCIDYAYRDGRSDLPRLSVEKSFVISNGTEANLVIDTFSATKNAII